MKRAKSIIKKKPDKMLRRKKRPRPPKKKPPSPDSLPLPILDADQQYRVEVTVLEARNTLQVSLVEQWELEYPLSLTDERSVRNRRLDPSKFFPPFRAFAIAVYRAYAAAILDLKPSMRDYEALLNYVLKAKVLNDMAPYRPTPNDRKQIQSEWEDNIWESWKTFDHPLHSHSRGGATRLAESLEDERRSAFIEVLSKALRPVQQELLAAAFRCAGTRGLTELEGPDAVRERRMALIRQSPVAQGLSMEAIARKVGTTKDALYAMARDDASRYGNDTLKRTLEGLKITLDKW